MKIHLFLKISVFAASILQPVNLYASEACPDMASLSHIAQIQGDAVTIYAAHSANTMSIGAPIKIDLYLCTDGNSQHDINKIDAWMPQHGHGMNYQPKLRKITDTHYEAEPFLFHMPGRWELKISLQSGSVVQSLSGIFEIRP